MIPFKIKATGKQEYEFENAHGVRGQIYKCPVTQLWACFDPVLMEKPNWFRSLSEAENNARHLGDNKYHG